MSTFTCEPGARLGGRYRLEDRVSASSGWSAWKAIDETLARPVTVLTFVPGFPLVTEVVTAARAASRLTDARLSQVFDVEEDWDQAYVVMEWVGGDSLDDLLAGGPLEAARGARLIAEAAEALTSAHAAGVAHLCLTPRSLRYTPGGGVKIVGLGIDAALSGTTADDPALADTHGLGRLLYAALTGYWPGGEWPTLPPAPEIDGDLLSPRQVSAGVPTDIDEVACQALFQRGHGGQTSLTTPALLASALADVIPAPPPPPASGGYLRDSLAGPGDDSYWEEGPPGGFGRGSGTQAARRRVTGRKSPRPGAARVVVSVAIVLALTALGVGAWTLSHRNSPPVKSHSSHNRTSAPPVSNPAVVTLHPVAASGFDPLSSKKQDPGNEDSNQAKYAIDASARTAWHSEYFIGSPYFGGYTYLTGAGLILDMGSAVRLQSVTVALGPTTGADFKIEVGNSDVRAPATLKDFTTVASASNVGGTQTFTVHSSATGRYVLIWFTKLPPKAGKGSHHRYQAEIFNVALKGSH